VKPRAYILLAFLAALLLPIAAISQEIDCDVTINTEQLPNEARENLTNFVTQIKQYINSRRWTKDGLDGEKIRCTMNIHFLGSSRENHYTVQAFIGSQRPIFKSERSTAVVRILDDKWEFDFNRFQSLIQDDNRFDPLLSFIDFYAYLILGYDFDTYNPTDGTQFFQKAMDIVNRARSSGRGWDYGTKSTYSRAQIIDELMNPKFRDFREAVYEYHYNGLDVLHKDGAKARTTILAALEKIGKLQKRINQPTLILRSFFDTKYLEIAEVFQQHDDRSVYDLLTAIDPAHQKTYDEYRTKAQ
jgi:hypothetical protein